MDWHEGTSMDTLGIDPFWFDENIMDFIPPVLWWDIEKANKKSATAFTSQDIEKVNKKSILNL